MKKIVFQLLISTAIIGAVSSCTKKEDVDKAGELQNKQSITIETGIASTKAYDTRWEYGDAIGVTMYNESQTAIIDEQFNVEYVTNRNLGIFYAQDSEEILYYPQDGSNIYLKAYYPYDPDLTTNMIIDWSVADQTTLSDIDLMTSEHITGFNKDDAAARLHFYHRLVKLVFLLSYDEENDPIDLTDCTLIMHGMQTGDSYQLFNDAFLDQYTGIADITVPLRNGEDDNERMAIVLPREAGQGVVFEFVTPAGDSYIAEMSQNLELKGGNKYTFYIVLTQNPAFVTATIEPWIDNDFEYYIAH